MFMQSRFVIIGCGGEEPGEVQFYSFHVIFSPQPLKGKRVEGGSKHSFGKVPLRTWGGGSLGKMLATQAWLQPQPYKKGSRAAYIYALRAWWGLETIQG